MKNGIYRLVNDDTKNGILLWVVNGWVINGNWRLTKKKDGTLRCQGDRSKSNPAYEWVLDNPLPNSKDYNNVIDKARKILNRKGKV